VEPGKAFLIPSNSISELGEPLGVHAQESGLQNIAFVALQVREKVVGFLGLELHEQGRIITSEDSYLLSIFSTDIAQLLEDARLFEQAKLLVAAEERNRLARELHDSVAQTLYSISLFINATRLALQTNKPKVVESHLEELTQLSREAMTDMRLLIFELRPPILEKSGLVAALQSRLESVEAKAGFETHFESEGTFHFSSAEESELYRIAQEALNNVIKHAQASHVTIRLLGESGCIRLMIEDDGVGFDPAAAEHRGGQGFRNMRERAANIGATCLFESVAGQGTKITIEVNE
jgi:signal transduction histidine kinase